MRLSSALRWMCCIKFRSSCLLKLLLFLASTILIVTLVAVGLVEEALSWTVSPLLVGSRASELRAKAANFNTSFLRLRTPAYYHIANANACQPDTPFMVSFVITAPSNVVNRRAIRKTWSTIKGVGGHRILTLFALGMPTSPTVQAEIEAESAQHSDIIQGLFTDTYRNLTLKTVMIMQWTATFCPHVHFVLKVDDDVYVNPGGLVGYLQSLGEKPEDLYIGRIHWRVSPMRDSSSKYYVSEVTYPGQYFPQYCSGTAYLLSGDVALKFYVASLEIPFIPMEDVYVGICTQKLGIAPVHLSKISGALHYIEDACCYQIIFSSHQVKPSEMEKVWQLIQEGHKCSWIQWQLGILYCKLLKKFPSY
ncbi:hypothetical protein NDU88_012931 [Pleurodeles waltl]|uniref:Hexosyltransferase n=2 Tax=Pleurodeles waltl TaxID=8319 RepID=A0AAV7R1M7_PLEWA|nr:hypothetical protein NDU88_012931 [Pleurodeles waltl]